MAVDPKKKRVILVVHGVQSGSDADLHQDRQIRDLVFNRLNGLPLDFDAAMYRYENINDEAQKKLRTVLGLFLKALTTPVAGKIVDVTTDIVGDVLIKLKNGTTAQVIRQGLKEEILSYYEEGNPLYLVAHSLGSIYAFDVVNELIAGRGHFTRDDRKTWPVQALVTLGSPIGLTMFKRSSVKELGEGRKLFRWINCWARTDPVVSGSFYGHPEQAYVIAERFASTAPMCGWFIQDRVVDIGKAWLMAHTGYWDLPAIGDDLAALITS
jgi:hypothetical protein